MAIGRPKEALMLTIDERQNLKTWARRATSTQRLALRARIILACEGEALNENVAKRLHVRAATVGKWRQRFLKRRLDV